MSAWLVELVDHSGFVVAGHGHVAEVVKAVMERVAVEQSGGCGADKDLSWAHDLGELPKSIHGGPCFGVARGP